jgi:TonB-dependent starch-binding outer membrane protein SusC
LNELKLRAAYGQSGTLPLYNVRFTPLVTTVDAGSPGEYQGNTIGAPAIKPESEAETELGFDATMFNSRAQLTFTVYQKRVSNLLVQAGLNPSQGSFFQWLNGGEFTNQGAEISLTATPVQLRNGFNWLSTISFFRNYSVMNKLAVAPYDVFYIREQVGRSVTNIVNPNGLNGSGTAPPSLGDVMPDFTVNFDEELHFGPFQVMGVAQWNKGSDLMVQTDIYYFTGTLWSDSAYAVNFMNRFNNGAYNWIEPAGFVKLRQVSLAYTLPQKWVNLAGGRISSARLSLVGRNLLQWYESGYHGLDPETAAGGNQNLERGIEITPYPPSRSFFLSLDLGF